MSNAAAGVACLILSCLLYAGLLPVPFLPFGSQEQGLAAEPIQPDPHHP